LRGLAIFRSGGLSNWASLTTNAQCSVALIEQMAQPDNAGVSLLHQASEQMRFSARAYHRVLKVARTLADLDGQEVVGRIHLAEAISYRMAADSMNEAA
jgi:magnesium chelatase family protein